MQTTLSALANKMNNIKLNIVTKTFIGWHKKQTFQSQITNETQKLPFTFSHFLGEFFQLPALSTRILNFLQLLKSISAQKNNNDDSKNDAWKRNLKRKSKQWRIWLDSYDRARKLSATRPSISARSSLIADNWSIFNNDQPQPSDSILTARSEWGRFGFVWMKILQCRLDFPMWVSFCIATKQSAAFILRDQKRV